MNHAIHLSRRGSRLPKIQR